MSKGAKGARLQRIFDYLYSHPSVMVNDIAAALQMEYVTVNSGIKALVADGLLQTANDYKRNRIFTFTRYLDIFRDDGACIGGAF